jgi:hypothetical protein
MTDNLTKLLANAEDAASMMLYKTGGISAMVYLHAKEGIFGLPYKSAGPAFVPVEQAIILLTVRSCYKAGAFEGLVMMSETWTAKIVEGDDRLPSERDDREEKVTIAVWDKDLKKTLALYPIIRNNKKVLLGAREPVSNDMSFDSWLDNAFKS